MYHHSSLSFFVNKKAAFLSFWVAWRLSNGLVPKHISTTTSQTGSPLGVDRRLPERGKVDPMHGLASFRFILSLRQTTLVSGKLIPTSSDSTHLLRRMEHVCYTRQYHHDGCCRGDHPLYPFAWLQVQRLVPL
jgi:hypothetical protein